MIYLVCVVLFTIWIIWTVEAAPLAPSLSTSAAHDAALPVQQHLITHRSLK